ncbi:sodium:solute symporter family protein [Mycolicibacterium goodii]|uniref:sodium:solute symporter family protein n=1 Tax=Mycolicibacterium goodii TaxID=134601 RepID=UPI00138F2BFC
MLIGVLVYRRQRRRTSSEFLVARKSMGMVVLGGTLAATQIGSGVALGDVGWIAAYGIGYYFVVWPFLWLGYWLSAKWVARKMLTFGEVSGATTIPDILAARYDSQRLIRAIAATIMLVAFIVTFSVQYRAASAMLEKMLGISPVTAVAICTAVFLTYTVFAGLRGIAYNDLLHIFLFVMVFAVAGIFAVHSAGGFSQVTASLNAQDPSLTHLLGSHELGFWPLLGIGLSLTLMFICYPIDTMKFYSAKDRRHLLRGIGVSFIFQAFVALAVICIGLAGRTLYPTWTVDQFDQLVPTLAFSQLPPVLGGLLVAAILGAIMAVTSAILLTLSAAVSNDLYVPLTRRSASDREKFVVTRIAIVGIAVVAAVLSQADFGSMAAVTNNVIQVLAACFSVTMLGGMASKRPNRLGAILSMIGGAVGVTMYILFDSPWNLAPSFLGFALSLAGMAVGIALGRPVNPQQLAYFFPPARRSVGENLLSAPGVESFSEDTLAKRANEMTGVNVPPVPATLRDGEI